MQSIQSQKQPIKITHKCVILQLKEQFLQLLLSSHCGFFLKRFLALLPQTGANMLPSVLSIIQPLVLLFGVRNACLPHPHGSPVLSARTRTTNPHPHPHGASASQSHRNGVQLRGLQQLVFLHRSVSGTPSHRPSGLRALHGRCHISNTPSRMSTLPLGDVSAASDTLPRTLLLQTGMHVGVSTRHYPDMVLLE